MKYLYIFAFAILIGCGGKATNDEVASLEKSYPDGTYCADVTYYNSNTGTKNTYTLNVDVENNEMTKIYWGNGGWLDDSHFSPQELDENGNCSFTSDKGYQYEIEITGSQCYNTDNPAINVEEKKREFTLTLGECAATMQMTESELAEYETTFNEDRANIISETMCRLMLKYITERRQLLYERAEKERELKSRSSELEREMENGYIQHVHSRSEGEQLICQQTIVKRRGMYYWLEVRGTSKTTMGLMDFDPDFSGWQNVTVKESPSVSSMQIFTMRLMDRSGSLASLEAKMEYNCNHE